MAMAMSIFTFRFHFLFIQVCAFWSMIINHNISAL